MLFLCFLFVSPFSRVWFGDLWRSFPHYVGGLQYIDAAFLTVVAPKPETRTPQCDYRALSLLQRHDGLFCLMMKLTKVKDLVMR